MIKVSIIIPVFNEEGTLEQLLNLVSRQKFEEIEVMKEVLVIDNGSTDESSLIAQSFCQRHKDFSLIRIEENVGKGNALKCGYSASTGDIFIVQDADLEYDPNDYEKLIAPIIREETKFVLGVRVATESRTQWQIRNIRHERIYGFFLNIGGEILSAMINLLYGSHISDQASMYKVIHKDLLKLITLESDGFDLEVEMICKFLRKGFHPLEIPVNYNARSRKDGKKIRVIRDGLSFLRVIFRYRVKPLKAL